MSPIRISAIAAIGKERELGRGNQLIWKLEADFKRMKALVRRHPLIMGRATYESIGTELPYSPSVVITRDRHYTPPYQHTTQTHVVHSLSDALSVATTLETEADNTEPEIFIFGGQTIYEAALPYTDRLYLTIIEDTCPEADSFFPPYDDFTAVIEDTLQSEGDLSFRFCTLERV